MADFAYAVHTDVCTYLLDETGVCLWVLSPAPKTAAAVRSCVGAHFMACIDTRVPGALVGELVEGAAALFVSVSKETGRPSLLRTGLIRRVQERHPEQVLALLEPRIEDIDVHFGDEALHRESAPTRVMPNPVAPVVERESETVTTPMDVPASPPANGEIAADRSRDLSGLDRPTEPRQSPLGDQVGGSLDKAAERSPADLSPAQPPPCPDLPEPHPPIPADLPKAAPTLVIDLPKEKTAEAGAADKAHAHGPPPLPKKQAGPPPLPTNVAHTPLPAPLPPPLPTSSLAHTPMPPPLPKVQGASPPPLPGQLTHTPLAPPIQKSSGHTPGPPPLPGTTDRSPVPPPVWLTHAPVPDAAPPALPLPPVVIDSRTEPPKDDGASDAASKTEGGKSPGSRLPKRKSSPDNSVSPATGASPRSRGPQPASKAPKQAGKKVPPPPLPPPPRSIAGARSSAFDENAPLPLRRRKKKD